MDISLAPLVQALLGLAGAALTAATPVLTVAIVKRLKCSNDAAAVALVSGAVQRGAGLAYKVLAQSSSNIAQVHVANAAVAMGVQYVMTSIPATLTAMNQTPEHIGDMVSAELGKLLAVDPTVTVGVPTAAVIGSLPNRGVASAAPAKPEGAA